MQQHISFNSADGQVFQLESAKWLSEMKVWEGNRNILEDHVKEIQQSLGDTVESLNSTVFRVAVLPTDAGIMKQYLIDGQHRQQVLKNWFNNPFSNDFQVMVAKKEFDTEAEVIDFFKIVNRTRAIEWKEDPNIVANRFIAALLAEFQPPVKKGKPEHVFFRNGRTRKPYICIELVRQRLLEKYSNRWSITPEEFIAAAHHYNEIHYERLQKKSSLTQAEQVMVDTGFCLACDENLVWI